MSQIAVSATVQCLYCEKVYNDEKQLVEHLELSSGSNCSIVKDFLDKRAIAAATAAATEEKESSSAAQVEEKRNNPEDHPLFGLEPAPLTRQKAICHVTHTEPAKNGSDCYYYYDDNDSRNPKQWYCKDCRITFQIKAMMEIHMEKKIIGKYSTKCSNIKDYYLFQ